MDLAYFFAQAWDFIEWFVGLVIGTVTQSMFGGWNAVFALGLFAIVFFVVTRAVFRRGHD